jgi:hypothetical protein
VPHRLPHSRTAVRIRVPRLEGTRPSHVHAGHHIVCEAGLTLVHPAHPDALTAGYPAPAGLHIPRAQQRPMTIQLPAPHRVGARAAPLAAG